METVTLSLPLEATTVRNPSDIRSNSSGSGATTERQWTDNGAIAERQRGDSRSDSGVTAGEIAGATAAVAERQKRQRSDTRSNIGATAGVIIGATA